MSYVRGTSNVEMSESEMGDLLEMGWERRGNGSSVRRNAEVWKFALSPSRC